MDIPFRINPAIIHPKTESAISSQTVLTDTWIKIGMSQLSSRYYKTIQSLLQRKGIASAPINLDGVRQISKLLNNPYNNYDIIHVAGTNGNDK